MNLDINHNTLKKESNAHSYIYRKKDQPENTLGYSRYLNNGEILEYLFLIPLSKERQMMLDRCIINHLIVKSNDEERV